MAISKDDILKLTVSERLELIETIWESISDAPSEIPLSEAQRREIDRRLDQYAANPPRLNSWDTVRAQIERGEER
jgi:putative addiction module component (TIGR02574 family)